MSDWLAERSREEYFVSLFHFIRPSVRWLEGIVLQLYSTNTPQFDFHPVRTTLNVFLLRSPAVFGAMRPGIHRKRLCRFTQAIYGLLGSIALPNFDSRQCHSDVAQCEPRSWTSNSKASLTMQYKLQRCKPTFQYAITWTKSDDLQLSFYISPIEFVNLVLVGSPHMCGWQQTV